MGAIAALVEKVGTTAIEGAKKSADGIKKMSETGFKEFSQQQLENAKEYKDAVMAKLDEIKNMTPEQLREKMDEVVEKHTSEGTSDAKECDGKHEGLTDEEKAKIKEETGWSDEIIDHIESMEQYEIYKNAGLHEAEINGRKCLVKDIDMDYVDPKTGKTNRELMAEGKSPIDSKTGEKIELHHMGQDPDGPFVELCENSEHGDGNHGTLHPKHEDSWRNDPELKNQYQTERANHWKERAQEGQG